MELDRRAALGAMATGAVALAAVGTVEALSGAEPLGDGIPASFGRLVSASGDRIVMCLFEAEDGTIRVVGLYMNDYGRPYIIGTYKRT